MSPSRSLRSPLTWGLAAVVVLGLVAGGVVLQRQRTSDAADRAARTAIDRLASAIAKGDVSGVQLTGVDGATAQKSFQTAIAGLSTATAQTRVGTVRRTGEHATATIAVRRTLPGGTTWAYDLPVTVDEQDGGAWAVPGDARLVHPDLAPGERLRVTREQPRRAEILGGDGKAIVALGDVVDVGIQPKRVSGSVATLVGKVADIVGVDPKPLATRVAKADPNAFVDVITLRRSDYDEVRAKLHPLPGVVFRERQQPLAPTKTFARALLGTVGPVTAEIVSDGKGRYRAGDVAGLSGLQREYDEQLAGTAGVSVEALPAQGDEPARQLFAKDTVPGTPLRLTLDERVQKAADAALTQLRDSSDQPSALVAVDVKTGAVLAVANSPASGMDRALLGKYAPGSTFKVVTTLSLLQQGLKPTDTVACPPTATVEGRTFKNYESEQLGPVPFRTDFAKSCNTAFVGLSKRLGPDDLQRAAASLGIGATWKLGTDAFSGSVPSNDSAVDRAAAAFGQGRTEVSPLALAVATASVARGAYVPPTLVVDGTTQSEPAALPKPPIRTLQALMRDVVTGGTGTALRSVPGGPVHAKTGTAEFGSETPPRTRAWITGWQGDIAFAVLVEEGKSGGTVAGPVAARFLTLLAQG
ncbi:MAG TPA: penicillin-binding transpeptidase domain-containing protein [Actinomycetales bacterium]|nr:penicillin-binding transpeptidase domain-containing protein [Actinomycetales bacterium]